LKHELDQRQVYYWSEVEAFAKVFFKLPSKQRAKEHEDFKRWVAPCVDRFKAIQDDKERDDFRDTLSTFVNLCQFLSQVMPYPDADLEMLYAYGRFVIDDLPTGRNTTAVRLNWEAALDQLRTQ
jgi:type I restriction enzyme R subunit